MTDYEQLTLQLKICEISLVQIGLELQHNGHLHVETEAILEASQENISILAASIQEATAHVETK
tara:strand:+ start:398 stop:589 length:192 start_codon:yes stop_codon:yes gene_type:complete